MFHFMRKEKSEEERAEKEERKRRKKELKERKKRDSLTSEDLHRLEEVRRSLRIKVTTSDILLKYYILQCCRSGSGAFVTPGSGTGMGKNPDPGILDEHSASYFR